MLFLKLASLKAFFFAENFKKLKFVDRKAVVAKKSMCAILYVYGKYRH